MNESILKEISDTINGVFSRSSLVEFKDNKSLDTLIKRVVKKLEGVNIPETEDDDVETVQVGRIKVTKIGEKSNNPRVVTPGDTARGDEHSENFYGRQSSADQMSK